MSRGEGGGAPLGSKNREIHGAAAAAKAVVQGKPFKNRAAEELIAVERDLDEFGLANLQRQGMVRLITVARLCFDAVHYCKTIHELDNMVKRFISAQNSANKAIHDMRSDEARANKVDQWQDVLEGET